MSKNFWQGYVRGVLIVYACAVIFGVPVVMLWWPVIERILK